MAGEVAAVAVGAPLVAVRAAVAVAQGAGRAATASGMASGNAQEDDDGRGSEGKNVSSVHDDRIVVKSGRKTIELRRGATARGGEWRGACDQLGFAHGQ